MSAYARILALTRSRLFTAVIAPSLIGAAYAYTRGRFGLLDLALIVAGLVCAELLNLVGYDYRHYLSGDPAFERLNPRLPGNPVVPERILPGRAIPLVLGGVALGGLAILSYFVATVGWGILGLLGAALAIGALYLFPFFPFAYLSTALLPPVLAGGVYYALSGQLAWPAFAAGLPIVWISIGVILNYRFLYGAAGALTPARTRIVAAFYLLAAVHVVAWVLLGLYPPAALAAAGAIAAGLPWLWATWRRERQDAVPATTVGVVIHAAACLLVAAGLLLGR